MVKTDKRAFLILGLFFLLHLYMGISFIRVSSPTYDETVHLSTGYADIKTGKYRLNIKDHPPLSEMISAAPLIFYKLNAFLSHPYYSFGAVYHYGDLFLYENVVDAEKILNTSRIFSFVLWSVLFPIFIYLFSKKIFSESAAFFALVSYFLFPIFISNNALITTDSASAFFYFSSFYFAYCFAANMKKGGDAQYSKIILAGLFTAFAMSSKYNMIVIAPVVCLLLAAECFYLGKFKKRDFFLCLFVYLLSVFLALLVIFKFDISLYFEGLRATFKRMSGGRSSFVCGHYSINGVWWYFPFAFMVKTPVFIIISFFAGLCAAAGKFEKKYIWLFIPFLVYFLGALTAKLQIGIRHILPLMPFVCVFAGLAAAEFRKKAFRFFLFFVFLISSFFIFKTHPYHLSFFNALVGGAPNGWKYLADSNVDWGQDVKSLATYLKKQGNPPVIFAYFGVTRPQYYGIRYFPFGVISNVEFSGNVDICKTKRILLAVSATNLQSVYYRDKKSFEWLKKETPIFRAGYSVFLYDLTGKQKLVGKLSAMLRERGFIKESECLLR